MKTPWYKDGLDFKCKGCAGCCYGFSGFVWLSQNDIKNISRFLKISEKEFLKNFTKRAFGRISLKELSAPGYECVFLKNKKCSIYHIRPFQCQSYPFWPQNLESPEAWKENIEKTCPGTKKPVQHYSYEEITAILEKHESIDFAK